MINIKTVSPAYIMKIPQYILLLGLSLCFTIKGTQTVLPTKRTRRSLRLQAKKQNAKDKKTHPSKHNKIFVLGGLGLVSTVAIITFVNTSSQTPDSDTEIKQEALLPTCKQLYIIDTPLPEIKQQPPALQTAHKKDRKDRANEPLLADEIDLIDTKQDPLQLALQEGNVPLAVILIQEMDIQSLNILFIEKDPFLCYLVLGEHKEVLKKALERRNLKLTPNKQGKTALHLACEKGDVEMVTLLAEKFPNALAITDQEGHTALQCAALKKKSVLYALLIKRGANPCFEVEGWPFILWLYQYGYIAAINACKAKGINLNIIEEEEGYTPFLAAVKGGQHQLMIQMLQEKPSLGKVKLKNEATLFHIAARRGGHELVQVLIDEVKQNSNLKGLLNTQARTKKGATPFLYACMGNNAVTIRIFLEEFVPDKEYIYACDKQKMTPLHIVAYNKNREACKCILNIAQPQDLERLLNPCTEEGLTPLMCALVSPNKGSLCPPISRNSLEMIKAIIVRGKTNLEKGAKDGLGPLMYAAFHGLTPVVYFLIQRGANVKKKTEAGAYLLHFICRNADTIFFEVFYDKNTKCFKVFYKEYFGKSKYTTQKKKETTKAYHDPILKCEVPKGTLPIELARMRQKQAEEQGQLNIVARCKLIICSMEKNIPISGTLQIAIPRSA